MKYTEYFFYGFVFDQIIVELEQLILFFTKSYFICQKKQKSLTFLAKSEFYSLYYYTSLLNTHQKLKKYEIMLKKHQLY